MDQAASFLKNHPTLLAGNLLQTMDIDDLPSAQAKPNYTTGQVNVLNSVAESDHCVKNNKVVAILFIASWKPSCKPLQKEFESLSQKRQDTLFF